MEDRRAVGVAAASLYNSYDLLLWPTERECHDKRT